jgi:hypothetical protein
MIEEQMDKKQISPFGVRMPDDLKMWVKMKSRMEGRSMNNMIVLLIRKAMEADNACAAQK